MRLSVLVQSFSFRLAALCGLGLFLLAIISGSMIKELLENDNIELTKAEAETALSIVAGFDRRAKNGEFSLEEAQQRARNTLRIIRFRGNDYLFVMNLNGILLVHGTNHQLEGNNTGHETDPFGFDFPQAMIAQAKAGGGHTHYYFPRPGSGVPVRKVSYNLYYEPWGWIVGAGIYDDDIEAVIWKVMRTFSMIAGGVFVGVSVLAYLASRQLVEAMDGKRRAEHEALQASKLASIGQLAAGIAHEINTPAQYVGDNLHFLKDELPGLLKTCKEPESASLSKDALDAVSDAMEGVGRISKIVNSMKEFSRPGTNEMTCADINRSLDDTLTVSQNFWKDVAGIECRFAPALPSITCYASEINQVFLSLILNAVEAIKASGKILPGRIVIETFENEGDVVVRISDNGPGIPEELRERIF
ncbi:MAG: hypothetical protein EPN26_07650, partial [Rhodospirillales bacterium]